MKLFQTLALCLLSLVTTALSAEKPRVLLLGDSFSQTMTRQVAQGLKETAEVVGTPPEIMNSSLAVVMIDQLLGEKKWDVIHFNFGLNDLTYRAPGMKSFRVMSKKVGGIRTTSPEDYEKNLTQIVKRLKKTNAKLIWASTTPIRSNAKGIIEPNSEIEYNAIAARIMKANGIPINDMHAKVSKIVEEKPTREEPYRFGKKTLPHPFIIDVIKKNL